MLFGAVVALLGAVVYLYMQLDHVKKDLAEHQHSHAGAVRQAGGSFLAHHPDQ